MSNFRANDETNSPHKSKGARKPHKFLESKKKWPNSNDIVLPSNFTRSLSDAHTKYEGRSNFKWSSDLSPGERKLGTRTHWMKNQICCSMERRIATGTWLTSWVIERVFLLATITSPPIAGCSNFHKKTFSEKYCLEREFFKMTCAVLGQVYCFGSADAINNITVVRQQSTRSREDEPLLFRSLFTKLQLREENFQGRTR